MPDLVKVIVVGGLNTDIIANGVSSLLNAGELTRSGQLVIGPGGKSRNIAQMIATYESKIEVHMIGKTVRDTNGLWQAPYKALQEAGVNVDAVDILNEEDGMAPGVALIAVDQNGRNQIYCLPGVNDTLCESDINKNAALFTETSSLNGVLTMALEMPKAAAESALSLAALKGLKTIVDPGGIQTNEDYTSLLNHKIYLLKPNEHEMEILSGEKITDLSSATLAARALLSKYPIENILLTHGKNGAYLINREISEHFPIPSVPQGSSCDETGCGDQVTAVMSAEISKGSSLGSAVKKALIAASLQFYRTGIHPVAIEEVEAVSF